MRPRLSPAAACKMAARVIADLCRHQIMLGVPAIIMATRLSTGEAGAPHRPSPMSAKRPANQKRPPRQRGIWPAAQWRKSPTASNVAVPFMLVIRRRGLFFGGVHAENGCLAPKSYFQATTSSVVWRYDDDSCDRRRSAVDGWKHKYCFGGPHDRSQSARGENRPRRLLRWRGTPEERALMPAKQQSCKSMTTDDVFATKCSRRCSTTYSLRLAGHRLIDVLTAATHQL